MSSILIVFLNDIFHNFQNSKGTEQYRVKSPTPAFPLPSPEVLVCFFFFFFFTYSILESSLVIERASTFLFGLHGCMDVP